MNAPDSTSPPSPGLAGLTAALLQQGESEDLSEQLAQTAELLGRYSGWRWAAIARLVDAGRGAQMLAFADQGQRRPGRTYEMAVAPCTHISPAGGLAHFGDVAQRFGRDRAMVQLGVVQYAGMAFQRGADVVGHVFVMHDAALPSAQAHAVDPLLQVVALHVSHRLELHRVRGLAQDWQRRAETDTLTGLPNRQAFERELALQLSLVAAGARQDSLLAILDLNRLKQVNDQRGHVAGDELIRVAAQLLRGQLCRSQDEVFRIGGDEFALLTDAPRDSCERWLLAQGAAVSTALAQAGFPESGLSMGCARLQEAGGERTAWLALADERMYQQKGARRRS